MATRISLENAYLLDSNEIVSNIDKCAINAKSYNRQTRTVCYCAATPREVLQAIAPLFGVTNYRQHFYPFEITNHLERNSRLVGFTIEEENNTRSEELIGLEKLTELLDITVEVPSARPAGDSRNPWHLDNKVTLQYRTKRTNKITWGELGNSFLTKCYFASRMAYSNSVFEYTDVKKKRKNHNIISPQADELDALERTLLAAYESSVTFP
jgi:hypothetical protein